MNKNIETFLGCDSEYEESKIVIFGAPFDSTTSYRPGTRFASRVMRAESYGLETYSPYQNLDVTDYKIFDGGEGKIRSLFTYCDFVNDLEEEFKCHVDAVSEGISDQNFLTEIKNDEVILYER